MPYPPYNPPHNDPSQDQDQDQSQSNLQANLQGQLQGQANLQAQGQGQGQGQGQSQSQTADQTAVQDLYSTSGNLNLNGNGNANGNDNWNTSDNDSTNENGNGNANGNLNGNANINVNDLDNHVGNCVDNDLSNDVNNTVNNAVNTTVNVTVDLDLGASNFSEPVIDLNGMNNIHQSLIMPDVVNQSMHDGNQFNIDQVNNLVDNDSLSNPQVNFNGGGADGGLGCFDPCDPGSDAGFNMQATVNGAHATVSGAVGALDHGSTGVSADTVVDQSAFNQTITMGANIQFNSQTITAGDDFHDSHNIG